ncbi:MULTISPECIES: DUF1611 domain-containing protein [unclassified Cyanobium]|uniref:DUF1611 domain-containing protein n=1 Tax=unclassified Cyanobium TaxID=2627006 RepID=UPI001647B327|nr:MULTISPECIES: DUF1611 domain-containing protein [unclassified Cyanobium]MBE9154512.1 DUF1611 domain-containing protein [Cyanobium sp. LEGE 06113]QNI69520.1 conserved hypothetical protein DUF1611 [Cyanobium sp. NS01]
MVQDAPSAPRVFASASPAAAIPAVIYCEGQFGVADGKTAHGLMRHSERYRIVAVIDSLLAGRDAGEQLDGVANGVPVVADLAAAFALGGAAPQSLIYGMAPANGLFSPTDRVVLLDAMRAGLSLVSGMREFLGDDAEFAATAARHQVSIEDVRRPPALKDLRLFSGTIARAHCRRIAVLGTDGAIGKRTTATVLVQALNDHGIHAVLVSTGQTGMIQGGRYGLPLDAIPSQFCSGEVEAAVVQAFDTERPQVIVIEGQGALSHPAYLSSTFILRGSQPQAVILQHAPMRRQRCDFPQEAMPTPQSEIALIEAFAPTRVIGMTLNHEGMDVAELPAAIALYEAELHIPVSDALACPPERLVQMVMRAFPELGAPPAALA